MNKGPTSFVTKGLIMDFEKLVRKTKKPLFERVVKELKRSSRNKRSVNLSKINRYSVKDANVLVLGKVLGAGELKHPVNLIAFAYSDSAINKLKDSKSTFKTLQDWVKDPKVPNKVVIIG
ncbi:MAG: 50S ribosomal protein L18e [Nanoarchaeota archaeon]|nr:50S ribosomal protein L18e [Nanoarchaeota archaeon]